MLHTYFPVGVGGVQIVTYAEAYAAAHTSTKPPSGKDIMRTRFFLSTLFLAAYTAVAIVSGRWLWGKFPTKNLSWQPAAATAVAVGLVAIFFVIRRSAHGAWRDLGLVGVGAVAATLLWKVGAGEGWRATGWLILAAVIGYAIVAVAAAVVGLIQRGRLPWLGQL